METIFGLATILQSFSISLGVGSSTLAILTFFAAIRDNIIDESERNLMGIVYIVLRVSMGLILITTLIQAVIVYTAIGSLYFSPLTVAIWTLITVLFVNAILMTKHLMPSTFGPAIQAGSWYTLGTLAALISVGWTDFTYWQFVVGYVATIALAVAIVNGVMAYLKSLRTASEHQD